MMDKQQLNPSPQEVSKAQDPLELVHTNLYGNMNTNLCGSSYFMTLINKYNTRTWVYFLKSKDEAFAKFNEGHALVEKETSKKLIKHRLDRGE